MEKKKNITVFGASGKIGAELLRHLSEAGVATTAVTRNKNKVTALPFVEWLQADMGDQKTLYATMEQSKAVFLLSSQGGNFVEEQNNVIKVAKELGVQHIVKLSSGAADKNSSLHIPKVHGEVEEFLKASGMGWTMLRPNGIMQNWLGETALTIKKERKIYEATADGKRAHADLRDIAEVALKVLLEPEKHANKAYLLTSDEAINYAQLAAIISRVIEEKIEFVPITEQEARQQMEQAGMPPFLVRTFLAYDEAQRTGQAAVVSSAVREILQRPARTVEAFAKDYVSFFK